MTAARQLELLTQGIDRLETKEELLARLEEGRPLRVKLGIDASGPDIHLGFAVPLRKLRQFQDLGHIAVLIVGNFTGRIGDPTDRKKTRVQLTDEEVRRNMARYQEQIFKILDPGRCEFRYNADWSERLSSTDIIRIASSYTVARLIEREDFKKRLAAGSPVYVHELLYPLFQGYDSVAVQADVELGGADQFWNLLVGRELQRAFGQPPQIVLTVPLLLGLDGRQKMSKSFNNYVGITDPPAEMFGKLMSIPDSLILHYFELCTDRSPEELKVLKRRLDSGENPRTIKAELAREIVTIYHSSRAAQAAEAEFDRVFRDRQAPEELADFPVGPEGINIIELVVRAGLLPSKSEARRKLGEGAIYLNGQRVTDQELVVRVTDEPLLLKVGKRRFLRLVSR